jgi:hypothetical protein
MPVNVMPSCVSRLIVAVELRASMSISFDCRAVKRSLAERPVNFTLAGSPNTAAATARQASTSRPFHVAGIVRRAETGKARAVDAALHEALGLDVVKRAGRGGKRTSPTKAAPSSRVLIVLERMSVSPDDKPDPARGCFVVFGAASAPPKRTSLPSQSRSNIQT